MALGEGQAEELGSVSATGSRSVRRGRDLRPGGAGGPLTAQAGSAGSVGPVHPQAGQGDDDGPTTDCCVWGVCIRRFAWTRTAHWSRTRARKPGWDCVQRPSAKREARSAPRLSASSGRVGMAMGREGAVTWDQSVTPSGLAWPLWPWIWNGWWKC